MADETTGFRFLVEQIQLRDNPGPAARERGREGERTTRAEAPRRAKPRQGAVELREPAARSEFDEPSFLSRRWL